MDLNTWTVKPQASATSASSTDTKLVSRFDRRCSHNTICRANIHKLKDLESDEVCLIQSHNPDK